MPTPYSPGAGSEKSQRWHLAGEKRVWNLDQNAGAVARFRIAAAGAAMRQVDENLQTLQNDVVRLLAFNVDNKTNAAGIVLMGRVI